MKPGKQPAQTSMFEATPEDQQPSLLSGLLKDTSGSSQVAQRARELFDRKSESPARAAYDAFRPLRDRVADEGVHGKKLMDLIDRANDVGEVRAGQRVVRLLDAEIGKLSREQRWNLMEILDGRAQASSPEVQRVADASRSINDEVAAEAIGLNVQKRVSKFLAPGDPIPQGVKLTVTQEARRTAGKTILVSYRAPFQQRQKYFPHVMPDVDRLKRGPIRRDVIENIQRLKLRKSEANAAAFLDNYVSFMESGKREQSLIDYMVRSGQAPSEVAAMTLLNKMRANAVHRQGSLEYGRSVNLPFWDPDPSRVLPASAASQSMRLAHIEAFGQDHQKIKRLVNQIRKAGDNHEFVAGAVKRILHEIDTASDAEKRLTNWLRWMNGFKLGLSAIPNTFQGGLNTMLAADVRAVLAGVKGIATKSGRRFGEESGAALESTLSESRRIAGDDGQALGVFLKAVGFTKSEKLNRIFAANAGASYAGRMLQKLRLAPSSTRARAALEEMGLDPAALLQQGRLSADDILMAGKKFSDLTQFRSRPQDLPYFASSTWGKMFFQFKSYIYKQFGLIKHATWDELRAGRPGRALRALLVLAIVFPMVGDVINSIRHFLKGQPAKKGWLNRYLDDLSATGASAVLSDLMESAKIHRVAETIGGPSVGTVSSVIESAFAADPAKALGRSGFKMIPILGQSKYLRDKVFPPKSGQGSVHDDLRGLFATGR